MAATIASTRFRALRGWRVWSEPRALLVWVLGIDLVALVWTAIAWRRVPTDGRAWAVVALLAVLAVLFEEGSRRVGRMEFRMRSDLKRDMTSVWSVAAAVALPPSLAALLTVTIYVYLWFRQERPAGEVLFRKVGSHATTLIGVLGAGLALHAGQHAWVGMPVLLTGLVSVVVVIVVHTCINRGLVTGALLLLGARGKVLLGTQDDNLLEIATLCLGGLVALAAVHQPWLCVLAIPPLVSLRRGSTVRELETAATTDSKTGLLNAIAWDQIAQRELHRAQRAQEPLAVLILDVDRFKLVNDRFGHLVGDHVLRGLGRVLESSMREYDSAGRFGGEEFVAVLPGADVATAAAVADRVRERIAELAVGDFADTVANLPPMALSVSIGVACAEPDSVAELSDLLYAADRALYRAKAGGRNQVRLAGDGDTNQELPQRV